MLQQMKFNRKELKNLPEELVFPKRKVLSRLLFLIQFFILYLFYFIFREFLCPPDAFTLWGSSYEESAHASISNENDNVDFTSSTNENATKSNTINFLGTTINIACNSNQTKVSTLSKTNTTQSNINQVSIFTWY